MASLLAGGPPPPPAPPEPPADGECCQSGCDPCILDLYQTELAAWRIRMQAWQQQYGEQAGDSPA